MYEKQMPGTVSLKSYLDTFSSRPWKQTKMMVLIFCGALSK